MLATPPSLLLDGRPRRTAWGLPALGLALAAVIAAAGRWGPDWPAQEFRAWTASHAGLTAWTNQWYSGHALPGYSVIYPAISALLGAPLTGLCAVTAAAAGAATMAPSGERYRAIGYHVSVGLVLGADLLIGQVPYLVGVAFGVWAFWSVRRGRPIAATVLAAASSLASPLPGAFLLLTGPAVAVAYGWRRALPLGAAVVGVGVSLVYGGAGGPFPFIGRIFGYVLVFAALIAMLTPRRRRAMRVFGLTYALAAVVVFAVPNPIGGNLARLGQLVALPILWHLMPDLRRRARRAAVALVLLAAMWPVWPSLTSIAKGAGDPSRSESYYRGLLTFLHARNPRDGRLEVVFTREHWESLYVARAFPLARGWERQTDLGVNHVLYDRLTPTRYRRWLDDNGVSLVALPNAPIDYGGRAEADLLRHPPTFLAPLWHDANWQIWRVRGAKGLVTGPATLRSLGTSSFVLEFAHRGTAVVRIRADRMWAPTTGEGCVRRDPSGWLDVTASEPGPLTLRARMRFPAAGSDVRCS